MSNLTNIRREIAKEGYRWFIRGGVNPQTVKRGNVVWTVTFEEEAGGLVARVSTPGTEPTTFVVRHSWIFQ